MELPDIGISYLDEFSEETFSEFIESIRNENLTIKIESREGPEIWACAEWYILPAIAAYISKSYFDGFLNEMGKDHYEKLKASLGQLTNKVMTKPKIEPVLMGTPGKISVDNPYSLTFAIHAQTNDGKPIKLLLPKASEQIDYSEIIDKFLEFLNEHYAGIATIESIGFDNSSYREGKTVFVAMNLETKAIEWLDERKYK